MFKQNCVIEIGDEFLIKHDFYPRLLNRSFRKYEYNINLLKESQFNINKKKAYIVFEGEKINIKRMTLPKIKNQELYKLIIDELSTFYNYADNILFNFSIIKDNGKSVDLVVFYSYEGKMKKLEKYVLGNSEVKAVYLIQFCFLKYFNEAISHKDFIFVFIYKAKLYLLFCINKVVIYNDIVLLTDEKIISEDIFEFIEGCRINSGYEVRNIYIANADKEVISDYSLNEYFVENLGVINEKALIKCIRTNRR